MVSDWAVARRTVIAAAVVMVLYFVWQLTAVLLQIFGAVLVALALHTLAIPLVQFARCPQRYAILIAALGVAAALAVVGFLFGSDIRAQVSELLQRLPAAWEAFQDRFELHGLSNDLLRHAEAAAPSGATILSAVQGFTSNVASVMLGVFLVLAGGIYLAFDPGLYVRLFISFWPQQRRPAVQERLEAVGDALRRFLKAQAIAMVVVGLLTWAGLALLGIPSAIALGLFTALAEFVPLVGPVVSAVPALLMALTVGTDAAVWTLLLFVVVQQLEGNVISPLLQQRMVSLPPAVSLFAVVVFGALFGPMGVLLAIPLTVVLFAAARGQAGEES